MRPRRPALFVGALSCALLATAAHPLAAQFPSDPCAGATQAQVSAALAMPVTAGQKINESACQWPATGANAAKNIRLTVQYGAADSYDKIKARMMPGVEKVSVSGVGDDALSQTMGSGTSGLTMLFVKKGQTMVTVRVYGVSDPAKQLAAEKAVAQAVVSKL